MDRIRRRIGRTGAFLLGLVVMDTVELARGQTIAWTRRSGSPTHDGSSAVAADKRDSSIYVAGLTQLGTPPGQPDANLRKYRPDGSVLWIRQFGTPSSDYAVAVAADAAGNIFVAGSTFGTLPSQNRAGETDAFVRKYDANGAELWTRQFGSRADDDTFAAAVDDRGNVYVAGTTFGALPGQSSAGSQDAFVRKYDANGTELWTRQFGGQGSDYATGVATHADGSIYVVAKSADNIGDIVVVRKYDAGGAEVWTRELRSTAFVISPAAIAVDADGSAYVVGVTGGPLPGQSGAGLSDAYVRKYSSNGSELWTRQFGSPADDLASAVAVDVSGVYVAGDTFDALSGQTRIHGRDAFVRKYSPNGSELWTRQFSNSRFGIPLGNLVHAVAADLNGSIYVAGDTEGTAGDLDGFLTKLVPADSIVLGDLNGDARVDCQDLAIVRAAFGARVGQPRWDIRADVDFDEQVDVRDVAFVSQRLPAGTRCP